MREPTILTPEVIDTLSSLPAHFFPGIPLQGETIELTLRIGFDDASVRSFGAYLTLIDREYGRMYPLGLRSYARRPEEQLKVAHVREGSLEMVIWELVSDIPQAIAILVLYLFLQMLPSALSKLAGAYRDYQQGRLMRAKRDLLKLKEGSQRAVAEIPKQKQQKEVADLIENTLSHNELIQNLTKKERDALVSLLEELLRYDPSLQRAAIEFFTANVTEVKISLVQEKYRNDQPTERA